MRTISLERLQILDTATARTSLCQMSVGQEMRASPPGAPLPMAMAGSGEEWGLAKGSPCVGFCSSLPKRWGPPGGGQGADSLPAAMSRWVGNQPQMVANATSALRSALYL